MPTKDWIPDILLLLHCILDERVGSYDGNGEGVVDPSDAIENTHLCSIGIAIFRTPDRFLVCHQSLVTKPDSTTGIAVLVPFPGFSNIPGIIPNEERIIERRTEYKRIFLPQKFTKHF